VDDQKAKPTGKIPSTLTGMPAVSGQASGPPQEPAAPEIATVPGAAARPPVSWTDDTLADPGPHAALQDTVAQSSSAGAAAAGGGSPSGAAATPMPGGGAATPLGPGGGSPSGAAATPMPGGGAALPGAAQAVAPDPMVGKILHHFRVLQPIGQGGMGRVYHAHDLSLDRPVALKVIAAEVSQDATQRERFIREARAQARLSHPNVVGIYYIGEQAGQPMIVGWVSGTPPAWAPRRR